MDNTLDLIVHFRDIYESEVLSMVSRLDQLPWLDPAKVTTIVSRTVENSLGTAEAPTSKGIFRTVAANAAALTEQRMRIGTPTIHIINELTDFVRDEMLQLVEHDLSVMSVHTARVNYAMLIVQFIAQLKANSEAVKKLLRAVALATRDGKPPYIDPADELALAKDVARRLQLERDDANRVAKKAIDETVSLVRFLAAEKFTIGPIRRLSSSYIAERGLLRLRHLVLKYAEDAKRSHY